MAVQDCQNFSAIGVLSGRSHNSEVVTDRQQHVLQHQRGACRFHRMAKQNFIFLARIHGYSFLKPLLRL